jgi:hypothetical protein
MGPGAVCLAYGAQSAAFGSLSEPPILGKVQPLLPFALWGTISMRGCALLLLPLILSGCGFGDFLSDTHGPHANPNLPLGASENIERARGIPSLEEPLEPEPGNVWPGPIRPPPMMGELQPLEKLSPSYQLPPLQMPPLSSPGAAPARPGGQSKGGAAPSAGVSSSNIPPGAIVIPNGDGTSTVIMPDGTIRTITTPPTKQGAGKPAAPSTPPPSAAPQPTPPPQ